MMHVGVHVLGFEGYSTEEEGLGKVGYISIIDTDFFNQVLKTRFSEILI